MLASARWQVSAGGRKVMLSCRCGIRTHRSTQPKPMGWWRCPSPRAGAPRVGSAGRLRSACRACATSLSCQRKRRSSRRSWRSSRRSSRRPPRRRTPRVTTAAVPATAAVRATGRPPNTPGLPTRPLPQDILAVVGADGLPAWRLRPARPTLWPPLIARVQLASTPSSSTTAWATRSPEGHMHRADRGSSGTASCASTPGRTGHRG